MWWSAPQVATKPKLASGVEILRMGPDSYIAINHGSGENFYLDGKTQFIVRCMDGSSSREAIRANYSRHFGSELPERTLTEFLAQLDHLGMLDGAVARPRQRAPRRAGGAFINRLFDILAAGFFWLTHPAMKVVVCAISLIAVTGVIREWDQFTYTFYYHWNSQHSVLVALAPYLTAWLLTTSSAAVMTGIVCRKNKGWINGLRLHFFRGLFPLIYCDIGDSFARMDQRGKWVLLTVRMWTYLGFAAVSGLVWKAAQPDSLQALYASVLTLFSTAHLVSSAIIFLPRDGYRIFMFLNQDSRLRERALAETGDWLLMRGSREALGRDERWRLRRFGLGIILTYFILLLLGFAFPGRWLIEAQGAEGGLVVFGLSILILYEVARNIFSGVQPASRLAQQRGHIQIRWLVRLGLIGLLAVIAILPYDYEVSGPARIMSSQQFGARAQVTGQLAELYVNEGELVEAGALLARIENPTITNSPDVYAGRLAGARAELALLEAGSRSEEIEIATSELSRAKDELKLSVIEFERIRSMVSKGSAPASQLDREKYQVEASQHRVKSGQERLSLAVAGSRPEAITKAAAAVTENEASLLQAQQLAGFLEIRSPIAGIVVAPNLSAQLGQYVEAGDLVLTVNGAEKLYVEVAAEEAAGLLVKPGARVNVRLNSLDGRLLTAAATTVSTVAETWLPTDPVRNDEERFIQDRMSRADDHRIRITADFEEAELGLRPGMLGYGRVFIHEEMFWQSVLRPVMRFFRTEVWSWLP